MESFYSITAEKARLMYVLCGLCGELHRLSYNVVYLVS
jgi:hypothetical protein